MEQLKAEPKSGPVAKLDLRKTIAAHAVTRKYGKVEITARMFRTMHAYLLVRRVER